MKNFPIIEDDNVRDIYRALSKSAQLLLGEEGCVRVVDGVMNPETGSFDVAAMARTLSEELEAIATNRIANNYIEKKKAPENQTDISFDDVSDEEFFGCITGRNIRPNHDPNALRSFNYIDDEMFWKGIMNPSSSFR